MDIELTISQINEIFCPGVSPKREYRFCSGSEEVTIAFKPQIERWFIDSGIAFPATLRWAERRMFIPFTNEDDAALFKLCWV